MVVVARVLLEKFKDARKRVRYNGGGDARFDQFYIR